MGKEKHQRTDDSIYIIVIRAFMWFYYHKNINFIYPFVLEEINLGELLTENDSKL